MNATELSTAIERARRQGKAVFVHGPRLEAARLSSALQSLYGATSVTTLDARTQDTAQASAFGEVFRQGLSSPQSVLHVHVGKSIPGGLWEALVSVTADKRLPTLEGPWETPGLLILSAPVKFTSDVEPSVGALFPVQVGDFS